MARRPAGIAAALLVALTPPAGAALDAALGRSLFERPWASAPSSTRSSDGLGPLYNARACSGCHRNGGDARGAAGTVARTAAAARSRYGRQLQTAAVAGVAAEGRLATGFTLLRWPLDGVTVMLRRPAYRVTDAAYGALADELLLIRRAPPLYGLGAIDRVTDATLLAWADPHDGDGDGVSGRAARAADGRLGRYGRKAEQPTLDEQIAAALVTDIGLSSPLRPYPAGDCTPAQRRCRDAPHGDDAGDGGVELSAQMTRLLRAYLDALPPPASAAPDPDGFDLFSGLGCAACHRPTLPSAVGGAPLRPYSDFLLHDLGAGLADPADGGGDAGPREWRTAPLWGLASRSALLHDGRARTPLEAILWHGGEAAATRDRVAALPAAERRRLLRFLREL